MAADGYDDILWDTPDTIADVGFVPPEFFVNGLLLGLLMICILFFVTVQWQRRVEGWTPIPDVDSKHLPRR